MVTLEQRQTNSTGLVRGRPLMATYWDSAALPEAAREILDKPKRRKIATGRERNVNRQAMGILFAMGLPPEDAEAVLIAALRLNRE